jgi:pimeloyl-ACP methyl ester carboxylesterase
MAKGSGPSRYTEAEPRVRRGYFESRFGQLHVHNAIPPGGGFDEATSLICIHNSPLSGRMFQSFLQAMGRDRSVYAPDLPGFGESDPPPARPTIADYAAAIGDFFDSMRFRQIDVLGYQGGSLVAAELAIARPQQVRRVVLAGVPISSEAERESFRRSPWPVQPAEDGSHLAVEWRRSMDTRGPGVSLEKVARSVAEKLRNGPNAWWGMHAALQYAARDRLALITQPTLVLRAKDELWDSTLRVREMLPRGRFIDLPDYGQGVFEVAPEVVANTLREFLRG